MTDEKGKLFFTAGKAIRIPVETDKIGDSTVMIRPKDAEIVDAKTKPNSRHLRLLAHIRHTEFLGGIIRYSVDVGGHSILVDAGHQRGVSARASGATVGLMLDKDQILVLARKQSY